MADDMPASDEKLKRERAGSYRTADGRFTVEQTSSGWLVMDGKQTDELGLALARGPFATIDAAKAAISAARTGPAPTSAVKAAPAPKPARKGAVGPAGTTRGGTRKADETEPVPAPKRALRRAPAPPRREVVIREFRTVDGDALRTLWGEAGFGSLGDDDRSLARLARRNPGLVLVAADGSRVVGSALGAWDGRRGWIYHVVIAPTHRRRGIATRLVGQIESALVSLGCPKANVMIRPDADGGTGFWTARGYAMSAARQYGKELEDS
ncbi:MAG TPA: GNAT family N-acetyltransferase [Candidatus Dormibacteraeota bacterium]|nr:GNAT family N-acetyltransferase [Candidatus Dormibacteraeota bacterium]